MGKATYLQNGILNLIFNSTSITGIADNAASTPLTVLYVQLHTANPGAGGSQSTSEAAYTGYARVSINRAGTGWNTSTTGSTTPKANITFPACTAGSETETYFSIGTAASGVGNLLYSGTVTPNIAVSNGVTPQLTTATSITES